MNGGQNPVVGQRGFVSVHQTSINGQSSLTPNGYAPAASGCVSVNNHPISFNGHIAPINGRPSSPDATANNRRNPANGLVNGPVNGHANVFNGFLAVNASANGSQDACPRDRTANGCSRYRNNLNDRWSELTNGFKGHSNGHRTMFEANISEKARNTGRDRREQQNGVNRLVASQNAVNDRLAAKKDPARDGFGITPNLRQLLRPTVVPPKRQENFEVDYNSEDINGPYNFRQLLRPAEYLPTESLRKRKGGLACCNGAPIPRNKIPEKHVKRRAAPFIPGQNKIVNADK